MVKLSCWVLFVMWWCLCWLVGIVCWFG
jgi:hypothetical protein